MAVGFFIFFMLRNSKKSIPGANTTAVLVSCKSVLVEETTIFTMLCFFLLQMLVQGRIFLVLILVTVWTVAGK